MDERHRLFVGGNAEQSLLGNDKTFYITTFGSALGSPMLFGAPGVQLEGPKFSYFGSYADSPPFFGIDRRLPYNTLDELMILAGARIQRRGTED